MIDSMNEQSKEGIFGCPFLCMRFLKPKAPNEAFRTPSTTTVDKLSSSYVLTFNVSTVNLGRVNMNFGLFSAFGYKI